MAAGGSAHYEAQRSLLEAGEYERLATEARHQARRYELAARTEKSVGLRLAALESLGWRVLADRRWTGSKRANVDFLLVGPGGVVVVDVKAWRALQVVNGSLFCEDECRDDEAGKLLSLHQRVQDAVSVLGLTAQALWPVLVFAGRRVDERAQQVHLVGESNLAAWLTRLGRRLEAGEVDQLHDLLDAEFPAYARDKPAKATVVKRRIVVPHRPKVEPEALFDVEELAQSILEAALREPIESWMTFLHPDQLRLVTTSWSGPARVRGSAGTGKTVVGLHRAAHLAERLPEPVLFVTFVKTLPVVLRQLAVRLSPKAADNIDFTGLHALAIRLLDQAGVPVNLRGKRIDNAFAGAWAAVGRHGVLTRLDERWSYWKEEIDYVIKGRGLTDFDEYADLARVGRRTPMRPEHREAMWELYEEYERRLRLMGTHDFNDVLILARDAIRAGQVQASYGSVIVDEVQDLTLVGVELLHAIAGDGPDRLLIIGDGQQCVYPGGFTLTEAGISVTGRASILRANYRNTAEILETAARLVANDSFDDLEGSAVVGARDIDVRRHGPAPQVARAASNASLEAALTHQIHETRHHAGVAFGDMAVLVQKVADVEHYRRVLERAGIPTVELTEYDGVTTDRVKIGTFKRAKGLEFKFVMLPGLREGALEPWRGESEDAFRERAERMRRELFVGMTRARDGLWLGYLDPSVGSSSRAR